MVLLFSVEVYDEEYEVLTDEPDEEEIEEESGEHHTVITNIFW